MSAPAGDEQGRVSVPLLSGVLPLALVAMAVLVGSRLVALNEQGLIAAGREHSTQFLNQELMELHAWLDAGRPPEELKTQLQVMALDSAVQTLAVIGGDHTVLASNHTLDAGAPASVLRGYDAAVATRASEGRSGLVVSDGGALVQEYVPIAVPSGRSASVPVLLYGTLDLTNEFAKLRAASWNSSARLLALVAASVLLLSALLNEAVIRRLRAVVAAMEGLARGDLASRSPVVGDDEIGAVGRAFNTMAGHVQQQHDQLVRSQARYQQVVEGSDDLVLVTTLLGQVLFVNQASVRMLGLEPEECLGRSVYEFVAPEDAQVAAEWAASVLDNGLERSNAEFRVVHRDGSRRFVLVNSRRVRDSGGLDGPDRQGSPGEHFEHFVRDRTEVLQAEAERRRMEEQVAHSERMSVIGQLAGGVAHDFNNQLAGILGYAELLAMRLPEGPLRSYAQRIEASAQHSAELTRKLLALSRRGKYREQAVDLHAVLDDVAGILRHSIDPRIEVKLDLQAGSAWVIGDGSQLQSAILNLGVNARDAMPDGGCLTLRSRESEGTSPAPPPHPESKRYLEIEVVDTGVGMDEQTLAQAFEPFFTTKAVGAGTGLGLPAVYGTVLAHRGTMHLDSAPGRGTSCRLWLPLADAPSAQEDSGRRTEGTGAGARILVVDDEAPVRDMLGEMLESAGFVVTACAGGVDALWAWKEAAAPFDLVILDLMMPGMNGAEFLAELLQLAPQARVLLLSGYADEGTTRQMMAAGAKGLLSKPCPRATLLEEVERVLSDAA